MKSTGIVRDIDKVGRIVIPKEIRDTLGLADGDPVEIFTKEDMIILRPYRPACLFCGNAENVTTYCEKKICRDCLAKIKAL